MCVRLARVTDFHDKVGRERGGGGKRGGRAAPTVIN